MAGGSANPLRQQMINMMYLVLTALLALNVSADILKAFALVNKGLDKTNVSYQDKNNLTMAQFAKLYDMDKVKAQQWYDNARNAKITADNMFNYLQSVKEVIAAHSGGWLDATKSTIEDDKNLEVSTHWFLNSGHGDKLKDSLNKFATTMRGFLGAGNQNAVQFKIDTQDPPADKDGNVKTWTVYYWEGVPSIAAITELTKFQNDVRNAEAEVTNYDLSRVGAADFKVSGFIPVVSTSTPSVFVNEKYKADIFLSAQSNTQQPEIIVNGQKQKVDNGVAHYEAVGSGSGNKELNVQINVIDPTTGKPKPYNTKASYQVFTGTATIAADKMNMLYIGLDNPITVAAPGFRPDQVHASASAGAGWRQAGTPGHYISKPDGSARTITVNVTATADTKTINMGHMEYRVRKVPKPEVLFGTRPGGPISRGEIQTVGFINAGLGEGFAFEGLKYTVNSYVFALVPKSGPGYIENVQGNRITGSMKAKLNNAHTGDLIVVGSVEATGPVGKVLLNGPTLNVR